MAVVVVLHRFRLLRTIKQRQDIEGLNTVAYRVEKLEQRPLYTWILVSMNMKQTLWVSMWEPASLPPAYVCWLTFDVDVYRWSGKDRALLTVSCMLVFFIAPF